MNDYDPNDPNAAGPAFDREDDPADPAVIDPTATTAKKTPEPGIEPAENAIAPDAVDPAGEWGKAAYQAWRVEQIDHQPAWEDLDGYAWDVWAGIARAAVRAYDAWLQGRADDYAEQVAAAPTFDQQVQEALAIGAVRPVDVNPGPIDTPAVISNPADEYQEALRIIAEQEREA